MAYVDFQHTENVLNTLKPPRLIQRMLQIGSNFDTDDIVMDFFSGSASTAHAVLVQNLEDQGNRQFIMVQYPEPLPEPEPHLDTIADMGKRRIRRVIKRLQAESASPDTEPASIRVPEPQLALALDAPSDEEQYAPRNTQDVPGFKVFKLAPSTFRRWEPPAEADDLEQQLSYFDAGLKDAVDVQHVLYEVLLKQGFSLNCAIETLSFDGNTVYHVTQPPEEASGLTECYVCLDDDITFATLDALPLEEETLFICQDAALNDAQKVNLALQCELRVV